MDGSIVSEIILYLLGCCAATTDLWTDKYNQVSYISFTLHYITSEWILKQRVLFALLFDEENESGENILRLLKREAERFGIDEVHFGKLVFVTDQGANLKKGLQHHDRFNCFAHLINLVLKKTFDIKKHPEIAAVNMLIRNCKQLVKHLKKSPKELKRLELKTSLKQSVSTRFNSHYIMIKSILINYVSLNHQFKLENQSAFGLHHFNSNTMNFVTDRDPDLADESFDDENLDWELIIEDEDEEELCDVEDDSDSSNNKFYINRSLLSELDLFLEQMDKVIKGLEFDKKPTFHRILLWIERIKDDILSVSMNDSEEIQTLKRICLNHFENQVETKIEYDVACMLDPDFRTVSFLSNDRRQGATRNMIELLKNLNPATSNVIQDDAPSDPRTTTTVNWRRYKSAEPEKSESSEVQLYMSIASLNNEDNLLLWWKNNENIYPLLSKLARKLLAIPATNTSSERAFSTAGNIVGKHRVSIKPETVNKLIFLHSNLILN